MSLIARVVAGVVVQQASTLWRAISQVGGESAPTGYDLRTLESASVPDATAWGSATDHGTILTPGTAGQWDARLGGSITPCTAVKAGNTHYLYYVGADGNRGDGGPANRKIGMASSSNGTSWTKYGSNPLSLTYNDPGISEEQGAFSAFAMLDPADSSSILLYYSSCNEFSSGSVNCDIYLAEISASDGVTINSNTKIIDHTQAGLQDGGDELFVLGVAGSGSTWRMLYSTDLWHACIVDGTSKSSFTGTSGRVFTNPPRRMGGGGLIDVSDLSDANGDTVAYLVNDVAGDETLAARQIIQGDVADLRTSIAAIGSPYTETGYFGHMTVYRA